MKLTFKVFQGHGTWEELCADVAVWVNANITQSQLTSLAMSESGRNVFDSGGTITVWYWS